MGFAYKIYRIGWNVRTYRQFELGFTPFLVQIYCNNYTVRGRGRQRCIRFLWINQRITPFSHFNNLNEDRHLFHFLFVWNEMLALRSVLYALMNVLLRGVQEARHQHELGVGDCYVSQSYIILHDGAFATGLESSITAVSETRLQNLQVYGIFFIAYLHSQFTCST